MSADTGRIATKNQFACQRLVACQLECLGRGNGCCDELHGLLSQVSRRGIKSGLDVPKRRKDGDGHPKTPWGAGGRWARRPGSGVSWV